MEYAYDYVNNTDNPVDDNGHGTLVAGAIVESTPSNVKVVPVKVMGNDGEGNINSIFTAITNVSPYVDIINLSLGSDSSEISSDDMETLENYFKNIVESTGVIIVCAAGNSRTAVEYPAASQYTLAASSIDSENNFADFSCFGEEIDFALPGVDVVLPYHTDNHDYVKVDGTSVSCPFLAASVALVKAENNEYSQGEIVEVLKKNCIDLGAPGKDIYFGYGSINFNIDMVEMVSIINDTKNVASVGFNLVSLSNLEYLTSPSSSTFFVECESACFVFAKKEGEENYTKLVANATGTDNVYSFALNSSGLTEILVLLKGDIDKNGLVTVRDLLKLRDTILTDEVDNLKGLEKLIYNVDGRGIIGISDIVVLRDELLTVGSIEW